MTRWTARFPSLLVAALLLCAASGAQAAAPRWADLDADQQLVLKPLEKDWDTLPEQRRERLAAGAQRWNGMSPEQQDQAKERLQRWKSLTPDQRARLQERRAEFRSMTPAQRERARERYQELRRLPPEERRRVRERFQELRRQPGGIDQACPGGAQQRLDCLGVPRAPGRRLRDR
jgi:hypothetical protein